MPGWRDLAGKPLPEIVTEQWVRITGTVLDDLEALAPERWCVADFEALLNDPQRELERLCEFVAIEAADQVTLPLRSLRDQLAASGGGTEEEPQAAVRSCCRRTEKLAERSRELLARPLTPPRSAQWSAPADSPLRSVYTQSFPEFLNQLGSSLLVSTYQTGKLICARYDGGQLNTHFRDFSRPMGLAVAPGRIAIGTRSEVLDYRELPGRGAEGRAAGQARRLLPAPEQALHRRHPHPRDRLRPGRALDRGDQLLLPRDARRRAQLHPALEAALHLDR